MTIIACGIGQPPVGRERGIEERPHAEDGGQGKQNAPVTHGKTLPSSGFRFECDCERTNQAENSHKAQNLEVELNQEQTADDAEFGLGKQDSGWSGPHRARCDAMTQATPRVASARPWPELRLLQAPPRR